MRVPKNWHKNFFNPSFFTPEQKGALLRAPAEVRFLARTLRLKKGERVLDLCCGSCRHGILLAGRGMRVTGLDFCEDYLAVARKNAKKRGVKLDLVRGDARKPSFNEEFDAVVNMWTSFGYFDDKGNAAVLRCAARALRRGGRLLIDTLDRDWLAASGSKNSWEEENGGFFLSKYVYEPKTGFMLNRWVRISPEGAIAERKFRLRLYSEKELSGLLKRAGFGGIKRHKNFPQAGNRLVMSAVKI